MTELAEVGARLLDRPIPDTPRFAPDLAPPGVEVRFVTFWQDRSFLPVGPRSQLVHTNAARGEGTVTSAWNWSHAAPNSNTLPHYQIDRRHDGVWARKMLPTDRRGIANATVSEFELPGDHGDISWWSLAYETSDRGFPDPGEDGGFEVDQADLVAVVCAYESVVARETAGEMIPLEAMGVWHGAGTATHTDPFGFPFTTLHHGKTCPGRSKKTEFRAFVLPRARQIRDAWLAPPPVPSPAPTPDLSRIGGTTMLRVSRLKGTNDFYLSTGLVSVKRSGDVVDYLIAKGSGDVKDLVSPAKKLVDRSSVSKAPRGSIEAFGPIVDA